LCSASRVSRSCASQAGVPREPIDWDGRLSSKLAVLAVAAWSEVRNDVGEVEPETGSSAEHTYLRDLRLDLRYLS
jgi:hypothetical protein